MIFVLGYLVGGVAFAVVINSMVEASGWSKVVAMTVLISLWPFWLLVGLMRGILTWGVR